MNAQIRTMAHEALSTQKQVADWQIEQGKLMEKQVAQAFEATRALVGLQRDLAQNLGKAWLDAVAPAEKKAE